MPNDVSTGMTEAEIRSYFSPLFHPRTIAVMGASSTTRNRSNVIIDRLQRFGFKGTIYPIHPKADEIDGLKAFPSLGETPEPIDYIYLAIPAAAIPDALRAGTGNVKFAHVISSGFSEIEEGKALQDELAQAGRDSGIRVLGPNCPGAYCPTGGLIFVENSSPEPGHIGVVSQSGGIAMDIIWSGNERGLRYRAVMTTGNTADVSPSELLEFYLADPDTHVIAMYLEGLQDGRRFFEILRRARGKKPVVIVKSGRTEQGQTAAVSHTGALAADDRIWEALFKQTGVVRATDLHELLDILLAFQTLTPRPSRPTTGAALLGNGGGTSVIAVDAFADRGLNVLPFRSDTQQALQALELPPGTGYINPIDTPAGAFQRKGGQLAGEILEAVYARETLESFVLHINLPVILTQVVTDANTVVTLLEVVERVRNKYPQDEHFALVLRSDGKPETDRHKQEFRAWASERGIPVYDELANAATALAGMASYERFLCRRPIN